MRLALGSLVFIAALALATAAPAKHARKHAKASAQATAAQTAPACRPLCSTDMSPCDPPEFKRADGRCDMTTHGSGGGGMN